MQSKNITHQSHLLEEVVGEFFSPEEFLQLAFGRLEFLKALYRKQLSYDILAAAPLSIA